MKIVSLLLALAVSAAAQSFTATVGQSVEFSVTAEGTQPFQYQWFFAPTGAGAASATPLPGATGQRLVVGPLQPKDAGIYYVRVSNSAGSATSSNLVFSVALVPPSNPVVSGRILP